VKTIERDLGPQPIATILAERQLTHHQVVAASNEPITHKMVARACKGRRLSRRVQQKVLDALNTASGQSFTLKDLFDY
jgi:hypothetical protein